MPEVALEDSGCQQVDEEIALRGDVTRETKKCGVAKCVEHDFPVESDDCLIIRLIGFQQFIEGDPQPPPWPIRRASPNDTLLFALSTEA